jgi:sugar diacid utilization regulator
LDEIPRRDGESQPSIVIVPREGLDRVANYELDVALRVAADAGVVGLVLVGKSQVPSTVRQLAERTDVRVFGCDPDVSIVSLVRVLDRLIEVEHHPSLERASQLREMLRTTLAEAAPDAIIRAAEEVLLAPLEVQWLGRPPAKGEPIVVGGHPVGWLNAGAEVDAGTSLALPAISAAIAIRLEAQWRSVERTSEIIAGVIHASGEAERHTDNRARQAGINLEDRHSLMCFASRPADGSRITTAVDRRHQALLAAVSLGLLQDEKDHQWSITRVQQDLAVLHTQSHDGPLGIEGLRQAGRSLLDVLSAELQDTLFVGGLSLNATGANGIRQLATEAQAAARIGRAQGANGRLHEYRPSETSQVLADLGSSLVSRPALMQFVEPIVKTSKSPNLTIATISALLDHGGSKTRAAKSLHLHPNAIKYRLDKVMPTIEPWLNDPDNRLMLHLGCRLWLLENQTDRNSTDAAPVSN